MRAAVFKRAGMLVVAEVPLPRPGPGEVLIKVSYCAICGSDVHKYAHGMMAPGVVMGHEVAGTVAAIAEDVAGWSLGDRVVRGYRGPLPPRYTSRDKGFTRDPLLPGGFAEYMVWPAGALLRIPEVLADEVAALTEPLSVALHAVRLSEMTLGDAVLVLGAGPIGLLLLQCVRLCGPRLLIVAEPVAERRQMALRLGADVVLDPVECDVVGQAVHLTGGLGPDIVFDCAGAMPTLQQALTMVRQRGSVVLVAICMEPCEVSPLDWIGREVRLHCSYGAEARDWEIALAYLAEGRVKGQPLISKVVSLSGIQAAFQELLRPNAYLQILVRP